MTHIEQTPLHTLIAGQTRWTNGLWCRALELMAEVLTVDGVESVKARLPWGDASPRATPARPRDQMGAGSEIATILEEFRQLPPTVLLGYADQVRWEQAVSDRIDLMIDESEAESRRRAWEKLLGNSER